MLREDIRWHKRKVLADWLKVFRLCLCQHVSTGHNSDISIRRTQGFDFLMLISCLPARSSPLARVYAFSDYICLGKRILLSAYVYVILMPQNRPKNYISHVIPAFSSGLGDREGSNQIEKMDILSSCPKKGIWGSAGIGEESCSSHSPARFSAE